MTKDERDRAEARFNKAAKAAEDAKTGKKDRDASAKAVLDNMARLKALRLAKEALLKRIEGDPALAEALGLECHAGHGLGFETVAAIAARGTPFRGVLYAGLMLTAEGPKLIEHNVRLVMEVCDRITVLNFGKVIARGAPAQIAQDPAVIAAYLGDGS